MPVWPEGVSDSEGEVCRVDTWIGADGAVAATRAQGCSTLFAAEAERALREWAMAPGESPRRTQVTVRFQPREE